LKFKENETVGLVVAAGMAERLGDIGNDNIKEMIEYKNNPIICNCIDSLLESKVTSLVIVVREGKEILVDFVKNRYPNTKIKFVYQSGKIGNLIDALKAAYEEIKHKKVLFRLGDTYLTPNPFVSTESDTYEVTLSCFDCRFDSFSNYGVINLDENILIDKPKEYVSNICWGAISWKAGFTEKLKNETDLTQAINKSKFNYNVNINKFVDIGNELVKRHLSQIS